MDPTAKTQDQTRDRILDEAEKLFAANGFAAVSVRQITNAADVNLAAVNYHFGNKHNLYLEVFRSRWLPRSAKVRQKIIETVNQGDGSPEEVIRAIATSFFSGIEEDKLLRHRQLMAREMADPGEAYELVVEQAMRPMIELVDKSLDGSLPGSLDHGQRMLTILSILSQVLYFHMIRLPIIKLTGHEYDDEFKKLLVDHVTDFSLRGLGLTPKGAKC